MSDILFFFFFVVFCHYIVWKKLSICTSNDHENGRWMGSCEVVTDKHQCMFSRNINDKQ